MVGLGLIATDAPGAWQVKLENLRAWIRGHDAVLIAVSGGIDSAFLWRVAHGEIGTRALAVTAVSPSLASWERDRLAALAAEIGGRHRTVETGELDNPSYVANPANRCYFCKDTLWTALRQIAIADGIEHILDGYNLDDVGDYRPGQAAGDVARYLEPVEDLRLSEGRHPRRGKVAGAQHLGEARDGLPLVALCLRRRNQRGGARAGRRRRAVVAGAGVRATARARPRGQTRAVWSFRSRS